MNVFARICARNLDIILAMENFFIDTFAILLTLFLLVLIPIYWKQYGAQNFLWLSDVGLFLSVLALWFHSSLLISMAIISMAPMELGWNVDYFYRLTTGKKLFRMTDYMFDNNIPKYIRYLSLFHIILLPLWAYCILLWGYNPKAPLYATLLIWIVLLATYFCTDPKANVNWVFYPLAHHWQRMPALFWLGILLLGIPAIVIWPMHFWLSHLRIS